MTSSTRLLTQHGKRYLTLSLLVLGTGFVWGALTADRPDWLTFFLSGLVFLGLSRLAYRSFRGNTMVEADCVRLLGDQGFDLPLRPLKRGSVTAMLHFAGRKWSLLPLRTNWANTRLVVFQAPCDVLVPTTLTIRRGSGEREPLPIRTDNNGSIALIPDAQLQSRLQQFVETVDYLDINLDGKSGEISIGVFGNIFNGPELRSNIINALRLIDFIREEHPYRGQ